MSSITASTTTGILLTISGLTVEHPFVEPPLKVDLCSVDDEGRQLPPGALIAYDLPSDWFTDYENSPGGFDARAPAFAELLVQVLALIVMQPFDFVDWTVRVNGEDLRLSRPTRQGLPETYIFAGLVNPVLGVHRHQIWVTNACWIELSRIVQMYSERSHSDHAQHALALRWFAKGVGEFSAIDRFMGFWIAFNALYEDSSADSEVQAIKRCIATKVDADTAAHFIERHRHVLRKFVEHPLEIRCKRKTHQLDRAISALMRKSNALLTFQSIALGLYAVRNRLFHGSIDPHSEAEKSLTEQSERLLGSLVREVLCKSMTGTPITDAEVISRRTVGF